jgi:hypothetical protein
MMMRTMMERGYVGKYTYTTQQQRMEAAKLQVILARCAGLLVENMIYGFSVQY